MSTSQLPHMRRAPSRGSVCVILAAREDDEHLRACLDSLARNLRASIPLARVEPSAAAVNRAVEHFAPADVVILEEPCLLGAGWIERLRDAARADTGTATASALSTVGTELSLYREGEPNGDLSTLAGMLTANTLKLRPRLSAAVGPCVYLRREAVELVGALDEGLELRWALEVDLAQRCTRSGLAHIAADDVVVQGLAPVPSRAGEAIPQRLLERYPELTAELAPRLSESSVLTRALEALRLPRPRLWVTLDARALDGALTGTQVHVLELILALAGTEELRLRLLVWRERIDRETLDLLSGLPETEILAAEDVEDRTPRSTVFHRPQQAFSSGDVELALSLGERVVLSQLDLIAYRNPGYFEGARAWEDYRRASRHGLSAAERVIVFSEHTRRELLSDALVEDARIRIVPPGLDHRAPEEARRPDGLQESASEGPFLLCLGTDFLHKNRVFALRLLSCLGAEHGWRGRLVFAGTHIPHGSSRELERAFLGKHPQLGDAVLELGSVSEAEKAWLLAHAAAVVYPSTYEGFGLVPFEAALSGVPCLFAPQTSLAEVAPGLTATLVPWDPAQSAGAAYALLTNAGARARHVEALTAAARQLTWKATAAAMVEIYREAAVAPVRDSATMIRDVLGRERALIEAHAADVRMLIDERERVLRDYDQLVETTGPGRALVGPQGTLPDELQRGLLALSARPAVSRPVYRGLARIFAATRATSRMLAARRRRKR